MNNRCDVVERIMYSICKCGKGDRILLFFVNKERLFKICECMLDEDEFFSFYGIWLFFKYYKEYFYFMDVNGQIFKVGYVFGDLDSGFFGGNSNWRGFIWFCVNFLFVELLQRFYFFFG